MPPHHTTTASVSFRNALDVLSKSLVFPPDQHHHHRPEVEDDDDESSSSSSQQEFHELYLQRQGMEFAMPILFEDGMDYIECELYYAAHAPTTPSPTKRLSALHKQQQRQLLLSSAAAASSSSPTNGNKNNKIKNRIPMPSCMRRRRPPSSPSCSNSMMNSSNHSNNSSGTCNYSESESSTNDDTDDPFGTNHNNNHHHHHHQPTTRRCSFAGMPSIVRPMIDLEDLYYSPTTSASTSATTPLSSSSSSSPRPPFLRSQSWEDLKRGVGFQEHVRVVTIHSAIDYPPDVRKNLWMSRRELSKSVRRALVSGAVRRKKDAS